MGYGGEVTTKSMLLSDTSGIWLASVKNMEWSVFIGRVFG
jgi:hypothetical protein